MAGFGPSKTSAAQTAYNASAVITAALINSKALVPDGDVENVIAQTLEVLGGLVAAIRSDLDGLVEEDLKSAPPAKAWTPKPGGYVSKDPGSEKLTKSAAEGGTSKVGGLTIRDIFSLPQAAGLTGKGSGADYINRLAEGKFGTEGMQRKAQAFLATLTAPEKAGDASPDYLG